MREAEKGQCSASSLAAKGPSSVWVAGEEHAEDGYLKRLSLLRMKRSMKKLAKCMGVALTAFGRLKKRNIGSWTH
jgi:hypothetical protein